MAPDAATYTLSDLCDLAAVTPRTVRYYITQGLLRSPAGAGPGARYDGGHLARLRLIRNLQKEHQPLAEIRRRLSALSDQEAIAFAEKPAQPPAESALDYIRSALSSRGVKPSSPQAPAMAPPPRMTPAPAAASRAMRRMDMDVAAGPQPEPAAVDEERSPYPDAESAPDRSQWERVTLDPDIELHVRRPLSRAHSRAVDRLVQAARRILKEDLP